MHSNNLNLLNDEHILFEDGPLILTNQRVLPKPGHKPISENKHPINLTEISHFKKTNVGVVSRLRLGLSLLLLGLIFVAIEFLELNIPSYIELFNFMVGISGIICGTYFSLMNVMREKPKTNILFFVTTGKNVYVTFDEHDNPKAHALTEKFIEAKKQLS